MVDSRDFREPRLPLFSAPCWVFPHPAGARGAEIHVCEPAAPSPSRNGGWHLCFVYSFWPHLLSSSVLGMGIRERPFLGGKLLVPQLGSRPWGEGRSLTPLLWCSRELSGGGLQLPPARVPARSGRPPSDVLPSGSSGAFVCGVEDPLSSYNGPNYCKFKGRKEESSHFAMMLTTPRVIF